MKQVIRYQCEFCKKEFKTPDRHYCKKNPELKNCFTCKHLKEWLGWNNDPENPDYQRFHAIGSKLVEKALRGELPNQKK